MPDPRTQLTAQELVYAASALRAGARRAERQAADPQYESCRSLFEGTAEAYDALAAKFARIAEQVPNVNSKERSRSRIMGRHGS